MSGGRSVAISLTAVLLLAAPAAAQRSNPDPGRGETAVPRESSPPPPPTTSSAPGTTDSGNTGRNPDTATNSGSEPDKAVPRTNPPPARGGDTTVIIDRGYGGYGYGGYYDPYDPERGYPDPAIYPRPYAEGTLRLKIKPKAASVYIDGYYTGIVDDMDGLFQKLRIEAGPHRIEVKEPGFETLSFSVRIAPDRTTTYRGNLKKDQ